MLLTTIPYYYLLYPITALHYTIAALPNCIAVLLYPTYPYSRALAYPTSGRIHPYYPYSTSPNHSYLYYSNYPPLLPPALHRRVDTLKDWHRCASGRWPASIHLYCTVYSVHCTVYSVQCTLYIVHNTLCEVYIV